MLRTLMGEGWHRQRQVWITGAVVAGTALIGGIALLLPQLWRDGEDAAVVPHQPPAAVAPAPPSQEA